MSENIKRTKAMNDEVKKLISLADGVADAKTTLQEGFSNAQEQFALRCAYVGTKFSDSQCDAIFRDIVGPNGERKSKASEARKWAHANVAPIIKDVFEVARKINDGKSVVGVASKMATQLKEGKATTATSAGDQVRNAEKAKTDQAKTPEGARKRAVKSVKAILKAGGYTAEDIAPVEAAINALGAPTPPKEAPAEPESPPVEQTGAALENVQQPDLDAELGSMLAGLLEQKLVQNGTDPERAHVLASMLTS